MAKIHVRGGSPLTLKFEDDDKNILAVRLEPKNSKGEYWVINEADDKKVAVLSVRTGRSLPGRRPAPPSPSG